MPEAVTQTCMRRLCGTGSEEKVVIFYGESSRNPHVKGTSPLKHDFGQTVVEWGNLEPTKDPFPITRSRYKNMGFTSVNFHLANGKNIRVAE